MAIILTMCVAWSAGGTAADAQPVQESRLIAGFLYNFTKFVEWPADVFASADAPFSICVSAEEPFGTLLEQAFRQMRPNGRALEIVRWRANDEPRRCLLLFVGEGREWQLAEMQARIGNESVLTVGEGKDFAERGGIIEMAMGNEHVHLEINLAAAARAHLKISSQLLSIGRVIDRPSDVAAGN